MKTDKYILNEIKLELTYRCPLKCLHCSSDAGMDCQPEMSYIVAANILEQAIALGVKKISFSGGEPLLWNGLDSLIRKCAGHNIHTSLYTSGISSNTIETIDTLKSNGLSSIVFSLYSATSHMHEAITLLEDSHHDTLKAIHHARSIDLHTELHFVPLKSNFIELPSVAKLAKAMGIKQISILRFVPQGRGAKQDDLLLTKDETLKLQSLIHEIQNDINVRIGSPYSILFCSQSPKCMAGINRLTISPNLSITPCDAFKRVKSKDIVGTDLYSSLDRWTLEECWKKSPYLEAIREYIENPLQPPCVTCDNVQTCISGCTAQKYLAYGQLQKAPDPLCLKFMQ